MCGKVPVKKTPTVITLPYFCHRTVLVFSCCLFESPGNGSSPASGFGFVLTEKMCKGVKITAM